VTGGMQLGIANQLKVVGVRLVQLIAAEVVAFCLLAGDFLNGGDQWG